MGRRGLFGHQISERRIVRRLHRHPLEEWYGVIIPTARAVPAAVSPYNYIEFNGTSSYIDCGSDGSLDNLAAASFTVDAWVNFKEPIADYGDKFVCSKGAATAGWFVGFDYDADWEVTALAYYDFQPAIAVGDTRPPAAWSHYTWAFDQPNARWRIAIGGVWELVYNSDTAGDLNPIPDTADDFIIGAAFDGVNTSFRLYGDVSWLRLSSGIRYPIGVDFTPPDRCAPPAVDGTTIELWALDEGTGVVTAASVVPANQGTMTDCVWHECT